MHKFIKLAALSAAIAIAGPAFAKSTIMVGGEEMFPTKTIVENAVKSADHTTLVTAVKAAGLVSIDFLPGLAGLIACDEPRSRT